jgi:hypothetical protein
LYWFSGCHYCLLQHETKTDYFYLAVACGTLTPSLYGILQNITTSSLTYTNYVYNFNPTSTSATLQLAFSKASGAGVWYLDDVSVQDVNTSTEMLINGQFETGNFSGWSQFCTGSCSGFLGSVQTGSCYQGTYCYETYCLNALIYLIQTITTTVGHSYVVSYFLKSSPSGGPGSFYSSIY